MDRLERISYSVDKLVRLFIGLVLFIMLLLVVLQVFLRYVFHMPLAWTDEISRYLMTWLVFIGASAASREGSHIGVTIFFDKLGPVIQKIIGLLINIAICGFLGIVIYQSFLLLKAVKITGSPVLQISMAIPYASVFIGCALVLFQTLISSLKIFFIAKDLSDVK